MDILHNLCRACNIEKEKLVNIHDGQERTKLIKDMLEYTLQITVTNESKYPQFICYDCLKQLEISYRFIKRFNLSQTEFEEGFNCLHKNVVETSGGRCITEDAETYYNEDLNNENMSLDVNLPRKIAKPIKQVNASQILPVTDVPLEIEKSPSIICSICNKTFFTQKALNLHLKLSHKQKNIFF